MSDYQIPFNRTSMESKHALIIDSRLIGEVFAFNRTSMESKHLNATMKVATRHPFNRTSMESKPIS